MKKLTLLIMVITLGVVAMAQQSYYIKDIVTDEDTWTDVGGIAEVNGEYVTLKYMKHNVTIHTVTGTANSFVDKDGNDVTMWKCHVTDTGTKLKPMVFGIISKGQRLAFILMAADKHDSFYILFNLIPQLEGGGYGL